MIPFKPFSERTLAHELLTFVKLTSVLKEEQKKLLALKTNRPKTKSDVVKWEQLNQALHHEGEIVKTEQRIAKLHHKIDEYEKEIRQYIPDYLYNKQIEINLYGEKHEIRYRFLLKVMPNKDVVVTMVKS